MHKTRKRPVVVGLTGGIASGKSTAAREFMRLGAEVIDTDRISREVVEKGKPALREIVKAFGREVVAADGTIDRKKLGAIVFADPRKRRRLEDIIHPHIEAEVKRRIRAHATAAPESPVILDVPLLYEAKYDRFVDCVVVIWVPKALQEERLRGRDGLSKTEIAARLKAQWPLREKKKRADFVVDNTGPKARTRRQIEKLWGVLTKNLEYV